uniref:Putative lipocalin-3 1 n=1 Tax=Amblyomma parvum TaxID=251391 RepID=A0A023FTW1_AMBPA
MAPKQSVKAIALALLATIIQSNAEEASSPQLVQPDIVKFYSNDSVIWSYSLNTDGHNPCKVDFGINSNPPNISFERYSLDWHRRTSPATHRGKTFSVSGEFTHTRYDRPGDNYDAMKITYSDQRVGRRGRTETQTVERRGPTETSGSSFIEALIFESQNENCGVFAVKPLRNARGAVGTREVRSGGTAARTDQTLDLRIKCFNEDTQKANRCFEEWLKSSKYAVLARNERLTSTIVSFGRCSSVCTSNQECVQHPQKSRDSRKNVNFRVN